ncbi:MAG: YncE family protein [Paludibacter sp.]|nr:YncE family protein [Paludibacter sp.]
MRFQVHTYRKIRMLLCVLSSIVFLFSCDDMEDQLREPDPLPVAEPTQIFVLSEGLFNMNNSTLAMYNLLTGETSSDYFLSVNHRGLGDTANDMGLYGSKLYIVVNVSSQIEVIDAKTGLSLKQIPMFNEKNIARQPRYIDFYGGKAYVCSFDGSVARIDTASLEVENIVTCGKNPDGICVTNGKIYVSNSGGLNYPDYDNSVSVIDIAGFSEIKKITVGTNPYKIHADSEGDVYVVTRGSYGVEPYRFQRINSATDQLTKSFDDIQALNFTIHNDTAYMYNYDFGAQKSWIKVFDCRQEKIISDDFISDGTKLNTPFGIEINPSNGDVYVLDACSFTAWGDVLCFDRQGKLKFRLKEIGLNPNKLVFR